MKRVLSCLFFLILAMFANAQDNTSLMHKDGKIYVVIAIVLVILSGLFFYVWRLDKKITKIENNNE